MPCSRRSPTPPGGPCSTPWPNATARPCSSCAPGWRRTHGLTSSRQAISQHLDVLEAAGLVHRRREGRYTFHDLDTTPLAPLRERWRRPDERT